MAYSSVSYSANSAANSGKDYTYSFPAVAHDTANILVTVGGTALAITRYTVASSGGTITLEAAPGAGTAPIDAVLSASNVLKVYRFTNRTSAEVVFSSTAIIQDEDLNTATDQGRYLALEAVDRANESIAIDETDSTRYNIQVEGADKRIFGIATPTDDKDAVNKAYSDANVSISNDNKLTAISYATRTDGNAQTYSEGAGSDTSDESAKNWAVGDHASNAPTEGSAKEWSLGGQGTSATPADGSEYAAKEYAQGQTATGGTAKQWALGGGAFVEGTPVTGSSYSAKKHATDSASSASDASDSETAAAASQVAAANSAAAVSAVYDDFADKYLGQMADGATATSGTANGTWAKNSSSITLASTSGTIEVGQLVAGTGIPAGSNILSIDGSTIVISNNMAALGSAVALTFTGYGVYGAYNVAKDGPATDNDNGALATGMLYFNSTDNEMRIYDGGNWIAASAAGSASILEYKFVATASQTTFSGTDANGATLSYTASNLIVFLNGVRLDASDYTASNGTSIVLGSGAAVSDELVVVAFKSFTAADTVPASTGGTFSGNVAITGNLSVDTIEQQGSSGIVLSHDVKLASGTAIKNAAGTALLTQAGVLDNVSLGSSVTGLPSAGIEIWQSIPFEATTLGNTEAIVELNSSAENSDLYAMPLSHNDHFTVNADGSVSVNTAGVYLILVNLFLTATATTRENFMYVNSADGALPTTSDTTVLRFYWQLPAVTDDLTKYVTPNGHGLVRFANTTTRLACFSRTVGGSATLNAETTYMKSGMTLIRISA